ncbi:hypothetical protein [Pseudoxanthomonas sp. z9]|nr:hypothetical protein [Pseudoxanthomonas sp. z9]
MIVFPHLVEQHVDEREDDVVITADGHRVLTDGLARSAEEIEAAMAG